MDLVNKTSLYGWLFGITGFFRCIVSIRVASAFVFTCTIHSLTRQPLLYLFAYPDGASAPCSDDTG